MTIAPTPRFKIILTYQQQQKKNIHAASIAEMESKTDSRPRHGHVSMLQSQEINSTAQYSFRTLDRSWHDACYV